jgi:hypothetical protein
MSKSDRINDDPLLAFWGGGHQGEMLIMTMSNLGCNDYEQNEIVQNCNFLEITAF